MAKRAKTPVDKSWPADRVERWSIHRLAPYAKNARTHSEDQIKQIARSIKEFGFTVPVLVDPNGEIIAGHGRVLAAKQLNLSAIPVMVARGWSEVQKRAYVIADNKIAENAGWDKTLLRLELDDLQALDFNLDPIGFSPAQLKAIMRDPDEEDASAQLTGLTYSIVIRCDGEQHQAELLQRFEKDGLNCEALIS